jgi:hypothetical protein
METTTPLIGENIINVKVRHLKETFYIFTDEYNKTSHIIDEISHIKKIDPDIIRLYFSNKRLLEPETTNHDQQVRNDTVLYLCLKDEETGAFENIGDLINFRINLTQSENGGGQVNDSKNNLLINESNMALSGQTHKTSVKQ